MFEQEFTIANPSGLHARPATLLTEFCKKYPQDIHLINGATSVNPKSIISVLAAGLKMGTTIRIRVEGENAQKVGEELINFLSNLTD